MKVSLEISLAALQKKKIRGRLRPVSECGQFYYDKAAAEHAVTFFEIYLRHSKGEWAGKPLLLETWQKDDIIRPLFGWKKVKNGLRRYTTCWVEVPRKNGKSTLAGGIALYLLRLDKEPGAEVYSAAADKDQASIVFNAAASMVEAAPQLAKRLKPLRRVIIDKKDRSIFYKILSADAFRQHGLNAHGVIFDEVHTQPNRDLWDVLDTAKGSRRQPLTFAITTAGTDKESICWELHDYARQIKEGIIDDPDWLVVIYGADEKEDWTDPKVWKKANPNLGVSLKWDYMRAQCKKAQKMVRHENTFRRLHLNQWTSQERRWIPMKNWHQCAGVVKPDDLRGLTCVAGLDLASTTDLAALVLAFRTARGAKLLPFFWLPEDNIEIKGEQNRASYEQWVKDGHIITTNGSAIDQEAIMVKLESLHRIYNIREVAFDRWGAQWIMTQIENIGIEPVAFGQGYGSMTAPSQKMEELILAGTLEHGANPVLTWMADNVVITESPSGAIKPDKSKSKKKIDGIVAAIMAIGRTFALDTPKESIYKRRKGIVKL